LGIVQTDGGGWTLLYSYNRINAAGISEPLVPDLLPSDPGHGYSHTDLEGLGFGGRQEALSSLESVRLHRPLSPFLTLHVWVHLHADHRSVCVLYVLTHSLTRSLP
jgi:hypothetical protein